VADESPGISELAKMVEEELKVRSGLPQRRIGGELELIVAADVGARIAPTRTPTALPGMRQP